MKIDAIEVRRTRSAAAVSKIQSFALVACERIGSLADRLMNAGVNEISDMGQGPRVDFPVGDGKARTLPVDMKY